MVWNTGPGTYGFEPGANQAEVGMELSTILSLRSEQLSKSEGMNNNNNNNNKNPPFGRELEHRSQFIANISGIYQYHYTRPYWTWWGTHRPYYRSPDPDETMDWGGGAGGSIVTSSPSNVTVLDFSDGSSGLSCDDDGDGATTPGCSVFKRRKMRKSRTASID